MRLTRSPRFSRLLVLLAVFQMFAPSVAAIADAWRLDQRDPYAHIESETSSSCVVVHAHDCALCSVATGPCGALVQDRWLTTADVTAKGTPAAPERAPGVARRSAASPRAPPTLLS